MRSEPYHRGVDDIIDRLRAAAPAILRDEPVRVAYLFGSHARGQANAHSDVDVAVLAPDVRPSDRLDLRLRLMSRLSRIVEAEADVIVLDESPLTLSGRVIRDGHVVYSRDDDLRADYESRIFRQYADFSRDEDEHARLALRVMAEGR